MQLVLNVNCDVEVRRSPQLGWESNRPDAFDVTESSGRLSIRQKGGGGTTIISGGGNRTVISTGGSNVVIGDVVGGMVIGGSRRGVWVNGKRVDVLESSEPAPEEPRLIVLIPDRCGAEIKTQGSANIYGDAQFGSVSIQTSGSSDVAIAVESASIRSSGSSDINLKVKGGRVQSSCSGSTSLDIEYIN